MEQSDLNRLRWQCRRGMLELDLLLGRFLDEGYPKLDAAGQGLFERFLAHPDPVLYDWLMGYAEAADPEERDLVGRIRACTFAATP